MLKKLHEFVRRNRIWLHAVGKELGERELKAGASKAGGDPGSGTSRVLIATSMGCYEHALKVETVLGAALTARGARVDYLFCDQVLPCCQMTKIGNVGPEDLVAQAHTPRCKGCQYSTRSALENSGMGLLWFGRYLTEEDRAELKELAESIPENEIATCIFEGLAVGEHAQAGALRYFARGDLKGEPLGSRILRRYLFAALLTARAVLRLLAETRYDVAVFHHGIYVPQGIIGEACRARGVRVVNWNPSYRKQTFIFSHNDSYHHTMIDEPVAQWTDIPWSPQREQKILDYLKSRWYGTEDWIWFHEKPVFDHDAIQREVGVDFTRPCIGLLTSVMWDAQLHYKSNAFTSMLEWVLTTIEHFRHRPDVQLLIRIHPAEKTGMVPARQRMSDEIAAVFPTLPPNVFVVPPESQVSTYALMERCNAVIIYNTKTGIEIASMGIPVIVAGEAWIRNKGFSIDASSPAQYLQMLNGLPFDRRMAADQVVRARKYAYHFFFRRMIELPFIVSGPKNKFTVELESTDRLGAGHYPGLDVICRGILQKTPFVIDSQDSLDGGHRGEGKEGMMFNGNRKEKEHRNPTETQMAGSGAGFDLGSMQQMFRFLDRIGCSSALQSKAEIDVCSRFVSWLGLPSHHDPQKNWDTLKSLFHILKTGDPNACILDAGSSGKSAILKWLSQLGFKNLYACDIRPKPAANYQALKVNFSVQDLTRTNYPEATFHAVTCISVIEHGVNLGDFLREMHRILKPGGLLLISTDFWPDPIDCRGIYPYGEAMGEMKVFTAGELAEFARNAERRGFALCSPLDLHAVERAVRWDRVDREYTFAFIALRKEG